jgi:hypothetical protein
MATWSIAIPIPIINKEGSATENRGNKANSSAPAKARKKAAIITNFSEYFSIRIPAGTDIIPYAMKNENGKKPAIPIPKPKLFMISGIIGPRIFVRNDMTKKISKISSTISGFLFFITVRFVKFKNPFPYVSDLTKTIPQPN